MAHIFAFDLVVPALAYPRDASIVRLFTLDFARQTGSQTRSRVRMLEFQSNEVSVEHQVWTLREQIRHLERWRENMEGSRSKCSSNRVVHRKSIGHHYTASIDCEDLRENHSTPRAKKASAAAGVVDQMDLLELIFTRLNLPALRLLKAVNKRFAASARRTLLSPSWLSRGNGTNLHAFRRLFASICTFSLPLRVVIESFCPDTQDWSYINATLLHLRVKRHGRGLDACLVPLEILVEIEGEGLHEDPDSILQHSRTGGSRIYTRKLAWDLSILGGIVEERDNGLGLLRPILEELSHACHAMGEPPVVGPTLAEMLNHTTQVTFRNRHPRAKRSTMHKHHA